MSELIFFKKFTNEVERVLHSPGNIPGKTFEMSIVIDESLSKETVENVVPKLLQKLKRHSDVFANVRLNMVSWNKTSINNRILPMAMAMISTTYTGYEQRKEDKDYNELMKNLRLFHARSKLIILFTDGEYSISSKEELEALMKPFLQRKLIRVLVQDGKILQ